MGKTLFFHQIIALTNFFSTFHLEKNVLTASRVLCNDFSLVGFFFIIEKYIVATQVMVNCITGIQPIFDQNVQIIRFREGKKKELAESGVATTKTFSVEA